MGTKNSNNTSTTGANFGKNMKKMTDIVKELNIKKVFLKNLIRNNEVTYEIISGVYYLDINEVKNVYEKRKIDNESSPTVDKKFLHYVNQTLLDFIAMKKINAPIDESLIESLTSIVKTKKLTLISSSNLYLYLEDSIKTLDYSLTPDIKEEHSYMFTYLSTSLSKTVVSASSGMIIEKSIDELEGIKYMNLCT